MQLIRNFLSELSVRPAKLISIAALAGIGNAGILAIINTAAEHASESSAGPRYAALFIIALGIYFVAQRYLMVTTTAEVESLIHRLRTRISRRISECELSTLNEIGQSRIYASVTREASTISQSTPTLVIAAQSSILIFFCAGYIMWLSMSAFLLTAAVAAIALFFHFRQVEVVKADIHAAMTQENILFESLSDILNGFKEAKMNAKQNEGLHQRTTSVSLEASEMKAASQGKIVVHFILSQASFYVLLAAVVFLLPKFSHAYSDVVIKTTTAILFLIGPTTSLVGSIPIFLNANAAMQNILDLEAALEESENGDDSSGPEIEQTSFSEITLDGIFYTYPSKNGGDEFSIGPIDLTLKAGETVFITGGNGSGKSTLLMMLTGLIYPDRGALRIDGTIVRKSNAQGYRNLISAVFSDYHLFRKLYGLPADAHEKVHDLLEMLELTEKTDLIDNSLTNIDLSSGQKKRVALMTCLLEDRPIYIFDEWAADQDPQFRRKFYEEILPSLKKQGKTIIAVTHDDRYFDCADHIIKMEEGRLAAVPSEMTS